MRQLLLSAICALAPLSSATAAEQGRDISRIIQHLFAYFKAANYHEQKPLKAEAADYALVLVGGYTDELGGYLAHLYPGLPQVLPRKREQRAYYHWNGGTPNHPQKGLAQVRAHLEAFRQMNPQAPLGRIGHSMGGASALELVRGLKAGAAIYLLTLDPVDRQSSRTRPANLSWWGNAHVQGSRNERDFIFRLGGRWGHNKEADVNLCLKGNERDPWGRLFIHDNAAGILFGRGSAAASLYELVRAKLIE